MLAVSAAYNSAAAATVRKPKAKIEITWTDPYLDLSIDTTTSQANRISRANQVADLIETVPYKWAHLDSTIRADGNFHPAPGTSAEAVNYQVGWWGNVNSGAGGVFASTPVITVDFSERPIYIVHIVGDDKYNEYPVDFTVDIFKDATLLYTITVTGNASIIYTRDITTENISEATSMALTISKWSAASRVIKISEFYSSIVETYYGDDIVSINALEEREVENGSLPIGNISANEIDIALQNIENRFFPGNTDSPLHTLIKRNRKIRAWIGFELSNNTIEYAALGTFWSGDWNVEEQGTTASTSGRDRMELLRKISFSTSQVYENTTLYALAGIVLEAARVNMPDMEYTIDIELQDFTIPYAYFPNQNYLECLKNIVEACMGQAYVDRNGILRIDGPSATGVSLTYDLSITQDDYFTKSQPAKTEELSNYVEVETSPLILGAIETLVTSEAVVVNAGSTKSISLKFNTTPSINAIASIINNTGSLITISTASYYSFGADIVLSNAGGTSGTCKIKIEGNKLTVSGSEIVVDSDADSIDEYGELKYTYPKNAFIQTRTMAIAIAAKLLASYKIPMKDISIRWHGNPALELVDIIQVPTFKNDNIETLGRFYVTKQKIDFDGTLQMTTDGRKKP